MRHKKLLERSKMFLFLLPHLLDFWAGLSVLEDIILALVNNICSSFASVVQGCAFACEIRKIRMRSENFAKFRIRIASQSPFRVSINFAKCQNIFMRIFRIMRNFAKCEYSRANSSRNFAKCEFSRAISLRTAISFEMQDFARFDFFKVRDFK